MLKRIALILTALGSAVLLLVSPSYLLGGGGAIDYDTSSAAGGSMSDLDIQQGGSAFSEATTLNFVGGTLSRSGATTTFTNNVSTSTGLTGDGQAATPISLNGPIQVGGSAFSDFNTLNLVGFTVSRSGGTTTITNNVSASSPVSGDGSSGSPLDVGLDPSLIDVGGSITLNGPVQAGGSAFSNFKTLNFVGGTVSRSGDVTTFTNNVSTTGSITGDGSVGSPIAVGATTGVTGTAATSSDGSGTALALANHEHALRLLGFHSDDQVVGTGYALKEGTNVSFDFNSGTFTINSSAAAATAIDVQQSGSAFASAINTLDFVGLTLTRSANVLTVTNSVSVSSPLAGDGSAGSPLDVGLDPSLLDVSGSITLNGLIQTGGSDFSRFKTLNLTGFLVTRTGDVTTVTNNVSVSTPITGVGSSGSPLDISLGTGLIEESGSARLWMLTRQGSTDFAHVGTITFNGMTLTRSGDALTVTNSVSTSGSISGDGSSGSPIVVGATTGVTGTAQASSNGSGTALALANHEHDTNLVVQSDGGNNAGLFDTLRFGDNLRVSSPGAGIAEIDVYNAGGTAATETELEDAEPGDGDEGLNTVFMTPQNAKWHPGVAKVWCVFTGSSGAIVEDYNVSGTVDNAAGDTTITIEQDMATANYAATGSVLSFPGFATDGFLVTVDSRATTGFDVNVSEGGTGVPIREDAPGAVCAVVFGSR